MCSRIQNVAKLANQVFSLIGKDKCVAENLLKLKCLVSQLHKEDLNLCVNQLEKAGGGGVLRAREAPVSFVEIYENDVFTLGVFILRNGARIPLHDHPGMNGIIKVIHGTVSVQSYSSIAVGFDHDSRLKGGGGSKPRTVPVKKNPVLLVDEFAEPCFLGPDEGNYHEIKAVGSGSAAFVDILAPPYDYNVGRECRFYRERDPRSSYSYLTRAAGLSLSNPSGSQSEFVDAVLVQCDEPVDYWTDSILYTGPQVRL